MKKLVIVESPAKTKKIASFLGDEYVVLSSKGHIRDLPKSQLGVDVENNYEPQYVISKEREDIVKELRKEAKSSDAIYLAPDLDREGEAIAWHLGYLINNDAPLAETDAKTEYQIANKIKNKDGKNPKIFRVVFNSITKEEVQKGFDKPRKINYDLVDAQQARRILDRLVGYKLSPLLWEKIRYGLSAGRVQSVAVRFVVEREREILNFADNPYFEIEGEFTKKNDSVKAKLIKIDHKNIYIKKKFDLFAGEYTTAVTSISTQKEANDHFANLKDDEFKVTSVDVKDTLSYPSPPFTTSTLQQSASGYLGYAPNRTMQLAQKLYEGGFITYMRTDSVHITEAELQKIRKYLKSKFGDKYLTQSSKHYAAAKAAKTQEAHEAIRPTDITKTAEDLPKSFTEQHKKLYDLIYRRTLATQMTPAVYENTKIYIENTKNQTKYTFEAKGARQTFDGYTKVYHSGRKDDIIPQLKEGDIFDSHNITLIPNQISAPPRYNESSLVKALESFGIGRPSTYASIVSTIQSRGYVIKKERNLYPTDNGYVVNDLLVNHFPQIVDVRFTAGLEEDLDEVAVGENDWRKLIGDFYKPFEKLVATKKKEIKKEDLVVMEQTDHECPECKEGKLVIKLGRYGKFYSCDRYPDCKYAQPLENTELSDEEKHEAEKLEAEVQDKKCPDCGGGLKIKTGKFGKFIACENYPKCKYTQQIQNKIGMKCPKCGEEKGGEVVAKKTKKGRLFYGCSKYPECDFASWKKPGSDTKGDQ